MKSWKSRRRKIRHYLTYLVVRGLISLSRITGRRTWLGLCRGLGKMLWYLAPETRTLMRQNLRIAFPDLSNTAIAARARQTFQFMAMNSGDVLYATNVKSLADLDRFMDTHDFEHFERSVKPGRGTIFLASHLGAFDLMVTSFSLRGFKPQVIGTPLKNKWLNDLLWKFRNAYGAEAIPRGKETFKLLKVLKGGGYVALLIDQDTRVKSRFVDFFGQPAATPVGAAILAMKTGAAVVPVYIYLGPDLRQHMHFLPEIPMRVTGDDEADMVYNTQKMTDVIEWEIRQHPEQWVWMHERWKTKPGENIE